VGNEWRAYVRHGTPGICPDGCDKSAIAPLCINGCAEIRRTNENPGRSPDQYRYRFDGP